MTFPRITSVLAASAALGLSGCAMAPSSTPPAMPSPAHYGAMPQAPRTVEAAGVTQQFDVGAAPSRNGGACIAPARSTRWSTKACARTRRWPQRKRRSPPRRRNCARRSARRRCRRSTRTRRSPARARRTFPAQVRKTCATTSSSGNCRRITPSTCSAPRGMRMRRAPHASTCAVASSKRRGARWRPTSSARPSAPRRSTARSC